METGETTLETVTGGMGLDSRTWETASWTGLLRSAHGSTPMPSSGSRLQLLSLSGLHRSGQSVADVTVEKEPPFGRPDPLPLSYPQVTLACTA